VTSAMLAPLFRPLTIDEMRQLADAWKEQA
jgi:hypothetical protein